MYVTILGRQPALGMAELEQIYGSDAVRWFSDSSALVTTDEFDFEQLGGSQKAGRVVAELSGDWRKVSLQIVQAYTAEWLHVDHKITLGISAYGFPISPRDVQKTGLVLKSKLKSSGVSLRLVPNQETALNTAASHHNKLGLSESKVELLVIRAGNGKVIVAQSIGAQNITAIASRDQARPKTDAFVGMLPPKLARMMVNLAGHPTRKREQLHASSSERHLQPERQATAIDLTPGAKPSEEGVAGGAGSPHLTLLDPFCGTGVVLQEAWLLGYNVVGTDLSEKMIDYTDANLKWLAESYTRSGSVSLAAGDAMTHRWPSPIDAVVCETYLGQPFSAPPSPAKLTEVRGNCNHIISKFLENLGHQLAPGTPLCVAVPAWRDTAGRFTHLPLLNRLEALGYTRHELKNVRHDELLYYRESQVVARELLILTKR